MKRFISFLLTLVLIFSTFAVVAYAEGEVTVPVVIESVNSLPGKTIKAKISLPEETELLGILICDIEYDDTKLELLSGKWLLEDGFLKQDWKSATNDAQFCYNREEGGGAEQNRKCSGAVFELEFKIIDNDCKNFSEVKCDFRIIKADDPEKEDVVMMGAVTSGIITWHNIVNDAPVEATCTTAGKTAGTHCSVCKKVFTEQKTIPAKGHKLCDDPAVAATCTTAGKTAGKHCSVCKTVTLAQKVIPAKGHNYVTTIVKAYAGKTNGSITKACKNNCGSKTVTVIEAPSTVELAKKSFTYTGKEIKPTVIVKDSKGNVIDASNYKVEYSNNKKIGKATITITFTGENYTGTLTKIFKIIPKKTKISKVSATSKTINVTWKKAKKIKGYEIQYSTSKKFTKKTTKTLKIKNAKTTSAVLSKIKANKKYYVRVRTYTKVKKATYKSAWSKVKTVKTKK